MTMNSSEFGNLPDGWAETRLPEIALINPKLTAVLDDELDVSFLPMKAVEAISGRADLSEERRIREVRKGYTCFCNGDVLWAKITPCMENGKAAVVRNLKNGVGFGSTEFHVLRPLARRVLAEWLFFFLIQQSVRRDARKNMTGSAGQLRVPTTYLADLALPLPSLVEQRAIVAKIEALFSELDKGVEQLQTIKQQLKQYRQAVLKAAFEGKLTAAWRAEQQAAGTLSSADELPKQIRREREAWYQQRLDEWKRAVANSEVGCGSASREKKPKPPTGPESLEALAGDESASLPLLPEGWVWMAMPWLLSFDRKPMTTGPFGTMLKKQDHRTEGVPVLGIENIGEGRFVPGNRIFVTEGKADDLSSFAAEAGDIIVSRSGTVGEICRVPDGLGRVLISSNLMRLSLNAVALIPELFVLMFQPGSPVKHQVKGLCKGSTRAFLNQTILNSLYLPIPGVREQRQILQEIESRSSVLDELEKAIDDGLAAANVLQMSILKKAFEGRLLTDAELAVVRNDSEYEPADKLLERIRTEKGLGDQPSTSRRSRRESKPVGQRQLRGNIAEARSEAE